MEERLDDAIHVLRHHAGEPQMAGLAAAAVGGGGGGHQNLSMMHSGGNHPNGMSGMSSYSGMGGISSHVDQMVRGSVIRERESEKKKGKWRKKEGDRKSDQKNKRDWKKTAGEAATENRFWASFILEYTELGFFVKWSIRKTYNIERNKGRIALFWLIFFFPHLV